MSEDICLSAGSTIPTEEEIPAFSEQLPQLPFAPEDTLDMEPDSIDFESFEGFDASPQCDECP